MIRIREYRPAYFEGFENKEFSFESAFCLRDHLDGLDNWHHKGRKLEWMLSWTEGKNPTGRVIMAVYDDNKEWWVYARVVEGAGNVGLPVWDGPPKKDGVGGTDGAHEESLLE